MRNCLRQRGRSECWLHGWGWNRRGVGRSQCVFSQARAAGASEKCSRALIDVHLLMLNGKTALFPTCLTERQGLHRGNLDCFARQEGAAAGTDASFCVRKAAGQKHRPSFASGREHNKSGGNLLRQAGSAARSAVIFTQRTCPSPPRSHSFESGKVRHNGQLLSWLPVTPRQIPGELPRHVVPLPRRSTNLSSKLPGFTN